MYQHLFAIVERLPASWRPPAASGGVVEASVFDGVHLIAGACDRAPDATARALAAYHEVIASAMDAAAVLPLSFGTLVSTEDLPAWLAARRARIDATLRELRGSVEMRVKLLRLHCGHAAERVCPACAPGAPGAVELSDVADRLVARAGVERWRFRSSTTGGNIAGSVAFLVPRHEVHAFLTRIAPVASRAAGIAVVPTGPWPAYSFVPTFDRLPLARVPAAGPSRERKQG